MMIMWIGKNPPSRSNNEGQKAKSHFTASNSPLYYLEDVSVSYGTVNALKALNLSIMKGEKIFLTGASGAGKTSLLKLLAGIIQPSSGRIVGPNINRVSKGDFVSLVFQDLRLLDDWTAEDNLWVSYDAQMYKKKTYFYEDLIRLCKMFGIQDKLLIKTGNLNGGARQKIAIVRSLLTRPSVLLADEPTSALDRDNTFKLYDILNYYTDKKGLTLVWASHNRELVKQFNGRIIHLEEGRALYVGHACFI
jgi:cell division transport system ATP-binding protein